MCKYNNNTGIFSKQKHELLFLETLSHLSHCIIIPVYSIACMAVVDAPEKFDFSELWICPTASVKASLA